MGETIIHYLAKQVTGRGERTAYLNKVNGNWQQVTWQQFGDNVLALAASLRQWGLGRGDRVAIWADNCLQWTVADLAVLSLGGITVPVYASNTSEQAAYIMDHAGCRLAFLGGRQQLSRLLPVRSGLLGLQQIIVMKADEWDGSGGDGEVVVSSWEDFVSRYRQTDLDWSRLLAEHAPGLDDLATLIYTSGTTGPPKGCMITHRNIMFVCRAMEQVLDISSEYVTLCFLPLAHALERNAGQFTALYAGYTTAFAESIYQAVENCREIRPHFIRTVPRLLEKVYAAFWQQGAAGPVWRRRLFNWLIFDALQAGRTGRQGGNPPPVQRLKFFLADRLLFSRLRQALGGRMKFIVSGGAPLSPEVNELFWTAGIMVLEGYGQTEATLGLTFNTPQEHRLGSVGRPLPGVEIAVAQDGEVLARGEGVCAGYYRDEQATARTFQSGWLYTGDVGRLDEQGYLYITDRKKDILITAGGKNVPPQNIENAIKTIPFIDQAVVVGDRKPYLTALLTLNRQAVNQYGAAQDWPEMSLQEMAQHAGVRNLIKEEVARVNSRLARFETIKHFVILPVEFSLQSGELTPSMKVKRRYVLDKYAHYVQQLYQQREEE